MTGWPVGLLQQAVDDCTYDSGRVEDCVHFKLQSEDQQRQCSMKDLPSPLVNEKVAGQVGNALPGGVPIQYGPGPATVKNPGPQTTTVAVPTATYSEGAKPTDGSYGPGQVFKEHNSTAAADITVQAQPSVTPAPEAPIDDGYEVVRTDYVTQGNVVNMIIIKEKIEHVTVTTTTYTSTTTITPLKARHAGHVHRHNRRHHRH